MSVTAHCIVKNEEVFIEAALKSVLNFVDKILIFDTGSTDATVENIKKFVGVHSGKVEFEEKGPCDKKRHTELRQEMLERTQTKWFMILDGDEIWTSQALNEAVEALQTKPEVECVMAPFYLCVGDVFHRHYKRGNFQMLGKTGFFTPRFFKKIEDIHWQGGYGEDTLVNVNGEVFFNEKNSYILKNKFWHLTHLRRSSKDDADYSSGGTRAGKRKLTYFFIGRRISEPIPEVLEKIENLRLDPIQSFVNFLKLFVSKLSSP